MRICFHVSKSACCAALLALVALSPARAEEAGCEVLAVAGEAWLEGSTPRALRLGERLAAGAELRTGAQGRVRLRCVDGSTLLLADRSQLRLERLQARSATAERDVSLLLRLGLVGQRIAPGGGRWEVRTPTAVTAVRGTEFMVEVGADQATAVHVQSGEVAVEALSSQPRTRSLRPSPPPLLMGRAALGTRCDGSGECSEPKPWAEQRLKELRQRLGEF